jgi:hypothetical protein
MKKKLKLLIELVPATSWYNNVRSEISSDEWNTIRSKCYSEADHKCEICGETGKQQGFRHDVECHEIWEYDKENLTQKLIGFISLCPMCHKVKHIGLAMIKGDEVKAVSHLMKVNNLKKEEAYAQIAEAFKTHTEMSKHDWIIDISYVDEYLKSDIDRMCDSFK